MLTRNDGSVICPEHNTLLTRSLDQIEGKYLQEAFVHIGHFSAFGDGKIDTLMRSIARDLNTMLLYLQTRVSYLWHNHREKGLGLLDPSSCRVLMTLENGVILCIEINSQVLAHSSILDTFNIRGRCRVDMLQEKFSCHSFKYNGQIESFLLMAANLRQEKNGTNSCAEITAEEGQSNQHGFPQMLANSHVPEVMRRLFKRQYGGLLQQSGEASPAKKPI